MSTAQAPAGSLLTEEGLTELLREVQAAQARVEASGHLRRNQTSGLLGAFAGCIQDVLRGALPALVDLDCHQERVNK